MHKILVTGANGQLGNELQRLVAVYPQFQFSFTDVAQLDITDPEAVNLYVQEHIFSAIINCAAYTAVDKAESDYDAALAVNATAPHHLAVAAKAINALLIHVSTDYVFDGTGYKPYTEEMPLAPLGAYGRTKLLGEQAVEAIGGKYAIVRTSWLYSSFGNNFVKTMLRLGAERNELNVVSDQIGSPTYAADLAKALLEMTTQILKQSEKYESGIYHYANEGIASWYDFAVTIMELQQLDCKVNAIPGHLYPTPTQRPHYSVLSKEKVKNYFGLNIPHWRTGLVQCLLQINTQ